jgi:hypothetical protein
MAALVPVNINVNYELDKGKSIDLHLNENMKLIFFI